MTESPEDADLIEMLEQVFRAPDLGDYCDYCGKDLPIGMELCAACGDRDFME